MAHYVRCNNSLVESEDNIFTYWNILQCAYVFNLCSGFYDSVILSVRIECYLTVIRFFNETADAVEANEVRHVCRELVVTVIETY